MAWKDKLTNVFNARTGAGANGAIKGINIGLTVASAAIKAGLIATVAPFAVAAAVGATALGVGGVMAYTGVRKANEARLQAMPLSSRLFGFEV
jgi:hypothetical protein